MPIVLAYVVMLMLMSQERTGFNAIGMFGLFVTGCLNATMESQVLETAVFEVIVHQPYTFRARLFRSL